MKLISILGLISVCLHAQAQLGFGLFLDEGPAAVSPTDGLVFELEGEDASDPAVDLRGGLSMYQRDGTFTFHSTTHKLGTYSYYNPSDSSVAMTNAANSIKLAAGGSITVITWIYPINYTAASHPVCRWDSGGTTRSWGIRNDSGVWIGQFSGNGSTTTLEVGTRSTSSAWTFIALRFNNATDTAGLRVNNNAWESGTFSGDLWESSGADIPLSIFGRLNSGTSVASMTGYIDQVLIFNRALSDTEVSNWYNSGSGLVP